MSRSRRCSRDECSEPVVGRRLCRKHYQQAWKAGELDREPLKPREVARTICPAEHDHARTRVCYVHHQCRCDACRAGNVAGEANRRRLIAYGRYDTGLVDAVPVREHMMTLAEFGIGYKRAAQLAGIGTTAARTLIWGRQAPGPRNGELQKRVKRETAEALLAVQPVIENLANGALVPSAGTVRRVQALVTLGWSLSEIARRIEMDVANISKMFTQDTVTARRHRAVEALFDQLWNTPARESEWRERQAASRARNFAKVRRWLPPLAWDDIDNDVEPPVQDEVGGVDEMAIELAISGESIRLSHDERREAITRLVAVKLSDRAIADRLHIADRTVLRIRQELGLAAPIGADRRVVA